ncbi:MAG TPA: DUF1109 domain-containing protein [Rickettsiales bacterium]|nr:DUF1109 domain-containing protein [Rickettsiales bacterium]
MQTGDLIEELSRTMDKVNPAPSPWYLFAKWLLLSAIYITAVLLLFLHPRPDLPLKLHAILFDMELLALAAVIISSLLSAALLAFPDIYQQKKLTFLPIAAFAVFCIVLLAEWHGDTPPSPLPRHAMACLRCITLLSLLPEAFILYNIRKLASTHYYLAGCLSFLAAFAIGALALRLAEPTDSIIHLLQWHYLPMAAVAGIGLLAGKLCLKW